MEGLRRHLPAVGVPLLARAAATLAGILAAVGALALVASPTARADGSGPIVVDTDNHDGLVNTTVTSPGRGNAESVSHGWSPRGRATGVVCTYHYPGTDGQPFAEERNGVTGRFYFRDCSDGTTALVWVLDSPASAPTGATVSITPRELAQRAVDQLRLPAPAVRHSPDQVDGRPETVVGIPTWWWVEPASFRTLAHTVRAGPVWARVTARPVATYWEPGSPDATAVRCPGPGTPYDRARPAAQQHTDCFTVYSRSSADRPQQGPAPNDRYFTAAVTVTWRVTWVGAGGRSGALPDMQRRVTFPIAVAEVQTVND